MNCRKSLLITFMALFFSSVVFGQSFTLENVCSKLAEHPNMKGDFSQVRKEHVRGSHSSGTRNRP